MKKSLIIFTISIAFVLTSCTSKNKTDYNSGNADTSGYKEQPQDKTQMNDTTKTMSTDTAQLHPDTIQH